MAVVAVTIDRNSRAATTSWTSSATETTYRVRFIVETDDVNDGIDGLGYPSDPSTGVSVPLPGGYYENIGNDTNRSMVAREINVSQLSAMRWAYDVTYKPLKIGGLDLGTTNQPGEPDPKDKDGKKKDWELVGPDINIQLIQRTRPAEKAAYIGKQTFDTKSDRLNLFQAMPLHPALGPKNSTYANPADGFLTGELKNGKPVINSAHKRFDPPLEIEYSRLQVNITRNHSEFPVWALKYQDSVNKAAFFIDINGFKMNVPPFAAKINGITGNRRWQNLRKPFWRVDYVLEIDLYRGWRFDILDRGKTTLVKKVDKTTNAVSYVDELIVDEKGHPIDEPALLDGRGDVAHKTGAAAPSNNDIGAYLRYAAYPERNFRPLKFHVAQPIKKLRKP
jgi:hypothetical protein